MEPHDISSIQLSLHDWSRSDSLTSPGSFSGDISLSTESEETEEAFEYGMRRATFHNIDSLSKQAPGRSRSCEGDPVNTLVARRRRRTNSCGKDPFQNTRRMAETTSHFEDSPMRKFRDTTRGLSLSMSRSYHMQRLHHSEAFAKWNATEVHLRRSNPTATIGGEDDSFAGDMEVTSSHSHVSGVLSSASRWTSTSTPNPHSPSAVSPSGTVSVAASEKLTMKCPQRKKSAEWLDLNEDTVEEPSSHPDVLQPVKNIRPQFPCRRNHQETGMMKSMTREARTRPRSASCGHKETHTYDSLVSLLYVDSPQGDGATRKRLGLPSLPPYAPPPSPKELHEAMTAATAAAYFIIEESDKDDDFGQSTKNAEAFVRDESEAHPVSTQSLESHRQFPPYWGGGPHLSRAISLDSRRSHETTDSAMKKPQRRGSRRT